MEIERQTRYATFTNIVNRYLYTGRIFADTDENLSKKCESCDPTVYFTFDIFISEIPV